MNSYSQIEVKFPDREAGYICPCCNRFCKLYKRSFNSNMALAAICLYRYSGGKYVHMEKFLSEHGYQRCGDASYLRFYNLIQKKEGDREDGSSRNGFYRLTASGLLFCELKLTVKKHFLIYNNKCEGFDGEDINILQALTEKFSYNKLMGLVPENSI